LPVIRPNEGDLSSYSFYLEAAKNMRAAKKIDDDIRAKGAA